MSELSGSDTALRHAGHTLLSSEQIEIAEVPCRCEDRARAFVVAIATRNLNAVGIEGRVLASREVEQSTRCRGPLVKMIDLAA